MSYTLNVNNNYQVPLNYVNYAGKGESSSIHMRVPLRRRRRN